MLLVAGGGSRSSSSSSSSGSNGSSSSTSGSVSISSFSPTFGLAGTSVTISGSNFSSTASSNTVKFNGLTATVSSSSSFSLTVTVPSGVTSGTISVTVNGVTATSTSSFTVSPWTNLVNNSPTSSDMYRVSCPNSNTCFALSQANSSSNTVFHRTTDGGTTWSSYDTGYSFLGSSSNLAGGLSCPDTSTCYMAGSKASSNKILKVTNASAVTPTIAQIGNTGFYYAISCPSTTFCIATGTNTVQRTTDGTNWTSISTSYSMVTIQCIDTNTCYGGLVNGKSIYKSSDASVTTPSWATQTISSGISILSLYCVDANNCMAVGNSVLAKTTDGTNWTSLTNPSTTGTSTAYTGVYCFDANTCTISGSNTTVWRTADGGSNWDNQSFGASNGNYGLSCATSPSNTCFISGSSGIFFKRSSN